MSYQHLFFDWDNTLWDFYANSSESFQDTFFSYKLDSRISFEEFTNLYHYHNDRLWAQYREGKISKEHLRFERFVLTFNHFGIEDREFMVRFANEYLFGTAKKKNLVPHAREVVEILSRNCRLHIITNGFQEVQHEKIAFSGLASFFHTITTSDEAGALKPEPAIFELALSKAGAKKQESLMIGDDYVPDILGARSFGIDQVFYNPNNEEINNKRATFEITSLEHLPALIM